MRAWARATRLRRCGRCGTDVAVGAPYLSIRVGTGRELVRCVTCEGPAPPDLPALVERSNTITPTPLLHVLPKRPLGVALVDWRARAAGEREPGCDDD